MLTKIQEAVIEGLMLGDGCVHKANESNLYPRLTVVRKSTDLDFIEEQANIFNNYVRTYPKIRSVFDNRTNKTYYNCNLQTISSFDFQSVRNRWYFDNKKIIPKDLVLNDLNVYQWFCDDGCITIEGKCPRIKCATHSFSLEENIFLKKILFDYCGAEFTVQTDNSKVNVQYYLIAYAKNAWKLIDRIDYLFTNNIMSRKSDKWRIELKDIFYDKFRLTEESNYFFNEEQLKIFAKIHRINSIFLFKINKQYIPNNRSKKVFPWLYSKNFVIPKYKIYSKAIREPSLVGWKLTEAGREFFSKY